MATRADNIIERACVVAGSDDCRGLSLSHLIMETLAVPGVISFEKLLQLPKIIQMKDDPSLVLYHNLLMLFAYGTYQNLQESPAGSFPELSQPHITKLKILTILSIASTKRNIMYQELMADLDIPSSEELESLIIDCVYHSLMEAKIDQASLTVNVFKVEARDVSTDEKGVMIATLQSWLSSYTSLLGQLTSLAAEVDEEVMISKDSQIAFSKNLEEIQQSLRQKKPAFSPQSSKSRRFSSSNAMVDNSDDDGDVDMRPDPSIIQSVFPSRF